MREKYPFTGHFGNTHGIPPFTEWGGGTYRCLLSEGVVLSDEHRLSLVVSCNLI